MDARHVSFAWHVVDGHKKSSRWSSSIPGSDMSLVCCQFSLFSKTWGCSLCFVPFYFFTLFVCFFFFFWHLFNSFIFPMNKEFCTHFDFDASTLDSDRWMGFWGFGAGVNRTVRCDSRERESCVQWCTGVFDLYRCSCDCKKLRYRGAEGGGVLCKALSNHTLNPCIILLHEVHMSPYATGSSVYFVRLLLTFYSFLFYF